MELKLYIGEQIKSFRKSNGLTQTKLAEKLGTTKQTISRYEKGIRKADQDTLFALCDIFGVTIDDFFPPLPQSTPTEAPNSLTQAINDKVVQLTTPRKEVVLEVATTQLEEQEKELIELQETSIEDRSDKIVSMDDYRKRVEKSTPGKVSAGTGYWQEDDYDTMVSFYEDEIPDDDDYDTIAIVVGHSMEPKIKNGDFLFIRLTSSVDVNKIGIFRVDGENYVKKLKNGYLESLNKDYEDIDFDDHDDIRVIGEVVDIYREG